MLNFFATILILYLLWIIVKPYLFRYAQRKYTEKINDMFTQTFNQQFGERHLMAELSRADAEVRNAKSSRVRMANMSSLRKSKSRLTTALLHPFRMIPTHPTSRRSATPIGKISSNKKRPSILSENIPCKIRIPSATDCMCRRGNCFIL